MTNQRDIVGAVNLFAADNDGRCPESVATIGRNSFWNWNDPRMLKSSDHITGRRYNSVSEYLGPYLKDWDVFTSPLSPEPHRYQKQAWEQGDLWDNPDTPADLDLLIGQYSFYSGYEGLISLDGRKRFLGPARQGGGRQYSSLVVSDYLGYGNWRTPEAVSSSRQFRNASICSEDTTAGECWYSTGVNDLSQLGINLNAGYIDGHVETFSAEDTIPMWIIMVRPRMPYPMGVGPGLFYLPENAVK